MRGRSWRTKQATDEVMRQWIDAYFLKRTATEESISYLVDMIRHSGGYRFPTNHTAAMNEFERLGFKLRSDRNEYGTMLRTYVQQRETTQ